MDYALFFLLGVMFTIVALEVRATMEFKEEFKKINKQIGDINKHLEYLERKGSIK